MSKPVRLHSAEEGAVFGQSGQKWLAGGTVVPADITVGYETGCLFIHTDGGAATAIYQNEGSATSCDFNAITTTGGVNLAGLLATADEINASSDVSARIVNVTDAATYTVLSANSGKPHIMPNFTASCTLTLPAVAAGLEYTFIGKAVAADAQNWIFNTGAAANFWLGGLSFLDNDAGAGADEVHAGIYPNGTTNDFMTIVTPAAGTTIHIICDGTNWIARGIVISASIPTFSDT